MEKPRGLRVCALGLVMMLAMIVVAAPGTRASGAPTWALAFSGKCAAPTLCAGFTTGQGSCDFFGTMSSGSEAKCATSFKGSLGVLTEDIHATAWHVAPGGTGMNDFFTTDGTVTFAGSEVVLLLKLGVPPPPGCTVSGQTITCSIAALIPLGLFNPDTLNPVIPGHLALNLCFGTGLTNPGCTFIQQLTLVT